MVCCFSVSRPPDFPTCHEKIDRCDRLHPVATQLASAGRPALRGRDRLGGGEQQLGRRRFRRLRPVDRRTADRGHARLRSGSHGAADLEEQFGRRRASGRGELEARQADGAPGRRAAGRALALRGAARRTARGLARASRCRRPHVPLWPRQAVARGHRLALHRYVHFRHQRERQAAPGSWLCPRWPWAFPAAAARARRPAAGSTPGDRRRVAPRPLRAATVIGAGG